MSTPITDAQKILVRVPNWVGDAVMSLPALEAVRARFPKAEVVVLARPHVADLYARQKNVNRVVVFEHKGKHQGFGGLLRLAGELRRERFDMAMLFQNAFQAALIAFLAGIPRRVGYSRDARRLLLTHPIAVPRAQEVPPHESYYYLELVRRAGWLGTMPVLGRIPVAPPGPAAVERVRALLRERGLTNGAGSRRPFVVLAPGAAYGSAKCWLPERYAALADRLVEAFDAAVLLCGPPAEARLGEAIAAQMRSKPVSLIGETSLEEFLAVLASADLFIGNDSGAMHLAAGLDVPQVVIFGPTDELGTGPLNPRARLVKKPVSCSPCFLRHCPVDHRCMTRIEVDEVWPAVEAALRERVTATRA